MLQISLVFLLLHSFIHFRWGSSHPLCVHQGLWLLDCIVNWIHLLWGSTASLKDSGDCTCAFEEQPGSLHSDFSFSVVGSQSHDTLFPLSQTVDQNESFLYSFDFCQIMCDNDARKRKLVRWQKEACLGFINQVCDTLTVNTVVSSTAGAAHKIPMHSCWRMYELTDLCKLRVQSLTHNSGM